MDLSRFLRRASASARGGSGVLIVAAAMLVLAGTAHAATATKSSYSYTYSAVMVGYCPFAVGVSTDAKGWRIDFVDGGGAVTGSYLHQTAVDTFSANGKTLTSLPFETNIFVSYDGNGNQTLVASGLIETVPLPNGSVFVSAGRAYFTENAQVGHQLSPDAGNPGDVAAFCAALSS